MRHTALRALVLFLLAGMLAIVALADEPPAPKRPMEKLTGPEIFRRVAEKYAKCKTFEATGSYRSKVTDAKGKQQPIEEELTVHVAFVRPDRCQIITRKTKFPGEAGRDECRILWHNAKKGRVWLGEVKDGKPRVRPGNEFNSLALTCWEGGRLSGYANLELLILMSVLSPKDVGGNHPKRPRPATAAPLVNMKDARRLADTKLQEKGAAAVDCYCIQGKMYGHNNLTFWVEKKSLLIRKVVVDTPLKRMPVLPYDHAQSTLQMRPRMDHALKKKALEFKPPW